MSYERISLWAVARGAGSADTKTRSEPAFVTSPAVSDRMSRQRVRDTSPEVAIRRRLFARGARFRVGYPVPERPRCSIDIAFPKRRIAIFVDGCFWHGCPEHGTMPKANAGTWAAKLEGNRTRDREIDTHLAERSWTVIRVWEHDEPSEVCENIMQALADAQTADGGRR